MNPLEKLQELVGFFEKATVAEIQKLTGCRVQLLVPNQGGHGTPSPGGWGEPDLQRAAKEQQDILWHLRSALNIAKSHETEK